MILSKAVIFTTMNLTSNIINQVKLILENVIEYNEYNWYNGTRWPKIFSSLSSFAYWKNKKKSCDEWNALLKHFIRRSNIWT